MQKQIARAICFLCIILYHKTACFAIKNNLPDKAAQDYILFGRISVFILELCQIVLMGGGKISGGDRLSRRRRTGLQHGDALLDCGLAGAVFLKRINACLVSLADAFELLFLAGELAG